MMKSTIDPTTLIRNLPADVQDELGSFYSDAHKDAYGFRPRHGFGDMTVAEYESEIARFQEEIDRSIAEERERDERDERVERELRDAAAKIASENGVSLATAWRWMLASEDLEPTAKGFQEYFWNNGLYNTQITYKLSNELAAMQESE